MKKITTITLAFLLLISFRGKSQITSWTPLTSGTTTNLFGVSVVNPLNCYVCGAGGLIMKTTDGGISWVTQTSTSIQDLYSIFFTDINNGIAVGNAGTMLRTTNGGNTWSSVSVTTNALRCVYFYDANTGYVTGGTSGVGAIGSVFKTTNGGANWTSQANTAGHAIYGITFTSATDGYFCDFIGEIFKTTNGGTTWNMQTSGTTTTLNAVDFTNPNNGIAG